MPQNFFITGMPKSGKTTILRRLIDELKGRGLKVGGFISPEEKEHGTRTGFDVEDIETGKTRRLAAVDADGPKVSKYHVDIKSFESIALPAMESVDMYDVFVVDEIGRMELKSKKFVDLLDKIFESPTPVIASLHRDYVERYGVEGEVVILTPTNREAVFLDLVNKTTAAYIMKKPKKVKPKARRRKVKPKKKAKPKKRRKKPPRKEKKAKKKKPEKKPPKKKRGVFGAIRDLIGV
jgi:nucleoside-triphosphatase